MSRYEQDELFAYDIEWYAANSLGQIAVFCTSGVGDVPEFVCEDKERNEFLIEFFDKLGYKCDCEICFTPPENNPMPGNVARRFSRKGLFYFDSDDCSKIHKNIGSPQAFYTKHSYPEIPLLIAELPESIRKMMENNKINVVNFYDVNRIDVK
ncbi:MAG: hypothetical protein K2J79_11085 [Ruminiclostridium sp.]|nr:hypothetical protein [Ruminiclostridium sp.]